jgi:hypothetical protein
MKQDEFDRALSEEIPIVSSSGFVNGVMEAVRQEASVPPPIPFPWKRALPGLAAGIVTLAAMVLGLATSAARPAPTAPVQSKLIAVLHHAATIANEYGINWILLAMVITLACVMLSMRLTAGSKRAV